MGRVLLFPVLAQRAVLEDLLDHPPLARLEFLACLAASVPGHSPGIGFWCRSAWAGKDLIEPF